MPMISTFNDPQVSADGRRVTATGPLELAVRPPDVSLQVQQAPAPA
jgi:hypothetical protein